MATEDQDFVVLDENDTGDFNPEGVLPLSEDDLTQIRQWLAPTDYAAPSSEWQKHCTSHLAGTGSWISSTEQYRQWHDQDRGGLWIKAVAGVGKSVAAATIVSNLASTEKVPVLYFFFRHIVSANQTPKSLVRDFLAQVLQYSPRVQHELFKLVDEEQRPLESVSLNELWNLLVSVLIQLPRVYCVIDALDEMDAESEDFLDAIVALTQRHPSSLKVLLTSRPIPLVECHFRSTDILQLQLHPHLVNPDISVYVRHRVDQHEMSFQKRSQIHGVMCRKAQGHFLYARLMLDDLFDGRKDVISDDEKLHARLNELPTPMADMYTQMLLDHSKKSRSPEALQVAILQWVTRAERPLRLLELSALINIKELMPQAYKDAKSVIRQACGPLLEIFQDETVHPIHHSFTEFLYDKTRHEASPDDSRFPVLDSETTQSFLATTCLGYIASGWHVGWLLPLSKHEIDVSVGHKSGDRNVFRFKYPWLDYVAKNWSCHVRKSRSCDEEFMEALSRIFVKDSDILRAWLSWDFEKPDLGEIDEDLNTWSPLHAAAHKGIACFIGPLLQNGCNVNQLTSTERTPLLLASRSGYHEAVQVLLQHGAKNNEPDILGLKPLHYAVREDSHEDLVKLLLDAGVDPYTGKTQENPGRRCGNAPRTIGASPVQYACAAGNLKIMKVIGPFLKGKNLQQALYWALVSGQTEIAKQILLRPDIDVNYYFRNSTPLYLASRTRDVVVMHLLIDMGADAKLLSKAYEVDRPFMSQDNIRGMSPLHAFAGSDHRSWTSLPNLSIETMIKGFSMLLEAGADPNTTSASGSTILHDILRGGRSYQSTELGSKSDISRILEMLFDKGLSAKVVTNDGSNALHLASGVGPDVLDTLLHRGVEIDAIRQSDGKTPLMAAVERHDRETVRYLLHKGANVNIADHNGNTVLHLNGQYSMSDVDLVSAKDLVAAGANVDSRNYNGDTALHVGGMNLGLVDIFVKHGFDLESKNKLGQTLLFQSALRQQYGEPYKKLVELGADPLTRDAQGRTILHALIQESAESTSDIISKIRYFVDLGVDPQARDIHGNNLWHAMAVTETRGSHHDGKPCALKQCISDYKVPTTARNLLGQSPIHVSFSLDHRLGKHGPINFLLKNSDVDVNVADHNLIRALHLAVFHDSKLICLLLERGADCTVKTKEGQTPLMIACRIRQCDVVCVLLDHYRKNHLLPLVDQTDRTGQTALHYACRSGRPETVSLLLEAGAGVHLKDKQGATPLHACAEVVEQAAIWSNATEPTDRFSKASYVLSADAPKPFASGIISPKPPTRVRESIRLLIEYGADISFLVQGSAGVANATQSSETSKSHSQDFRSPLAKAWTKECVSMVSELYLAKCRLLHERRMDESKTKIGCQMKINSEVLDKEANAMVADRMNSFQSRINFSRMLYTPEAIAASVEMGRSNLSLVETLLQYDDEPGVRQLVRLGARLDLPDYNGDKGFDHLASNGLADLLHDLIDYTIRITEANATVTVSTTTEGVNLKSVLLTALARPIPNLAVVKVVVSKLDHNVNEIFDAEDDERTTQSYVHKLAIPSYWWQTQALAYMLDHGANVDVTNSDGETALILALRNPRHHPYDFHSAQIRVVEILLEHGANPNAMNKDGLTCLNLAAQQPRCIEALLKFGADPLSGTRSFLLDAIAAQDVDMIRHIIASGADLNRRSNSASKLGSVAMYSAWNNKGRNGSPRTISESLNDPQSIEELIEYGYPIHVAASKFHNTPEKQSLALEIIRTLLNGKADPWLTYEDGSSIVHCLVRDRGILDPFVTLNSFDTELRDRKGCTLLLAACGSWYGRDVDQEWVLESHDTIKMLLDHGASRTAIDNAGRSALHHLVNAVPYRHHYRRASAPAIDAAECQGILQPFLTSSLSRTDACGRTPYHYAVMRHHVDLIHILLANGADCSMVDPVDGTTALHHLAPHLVSSEAWLFGENEAPEQKRNLFIKRFRGSLIRIHPHNEIVANEVCLEQFEQAKLQSPYSLFEPLIARGLGVNHRDMEGETPVLKLADKGASAASWYTDEEASIDGGVLHQTFQVMERAGADLKIRNHLGESVLHKLAKHAAAMSPYTREILDCVPPSKDLAETFKWLVNKGLDVAWEDHEQRTCLDVAAASGATWLTQLYERNS